MGNSAVIDNIGKLAESGAELCVRTPVIPGVNDRREDIEEYRTAGTACYVRVLGFRKDSAPLLTSIKKNCDLPLITRLADAEALLGPAGRRMLCTDLYAASVRAILEARKSGGKVQNEYTRQLVIL